MCPDQSERRRSRSHGSPLRDRRSHVRTKHTQVSASWHAVLPHSSGGPFFRGLAPILFRPADLVVRARIIAITMNSRSYYASVAPPPKWRPGASYRARRTHSSRLLLFLSWRLRCRHVVLRYTARQLTSRMAAADGGDNWPCQDYDSTFTLLHDSLGRSPLALYILYRTQPQRDFRSRWKPRFYIRYESNHPLIPYLPRSFDPLFPTTIKSDVSREFDHNTTDILYAWIESRRTTVYKSSPLEWKLLVIASSSYQLNLNYYHVITCCTHEKNFLRSFYYLHICTCHVLHGFTFLVSPCNAFRCATRRPRRQIAKVRRTSGTRGGK